MQIEASSGSVSNVRATSSRQARHIGRHLVAFAPGLLLTGAIAAVATALASVGWVQARGGNALTIALLVGVVVGNTVFGRVALPCTAGVNFSKQRLLRIGIVLYGLRLTFADIGHVGVVGVAIDALMLSGTFLLATVVGTRWLGLDRATAMLIGAGSAICGAAAVLATAPVVRARTEQVAVAIATVVVFGSVAMFAYPWLYAWNAAHRFVAIAPSGFGVFIGSTVHEVAQVIAAAGPLGEGAADTAIVAKLVRVLMLGPFLFALTAWLAHRPASKADADDTARRSIALPWFALGFVALAGVHSVIELPTPLHRALLDVDAALLAMAMAALGVTTHVSAIRRAGAKPLLLGALLFGWLVIGGLAVNVGVTRLFANG